MHVPPSPEASPPRFVTIAISLVALLVVGGHVLATLIYLGPPNIAKERLGAPAEAYMRPLFYQNWHLFSPNPGISTQKMAIRCGPESGPYSEWFDPLEGLTSEHHANRISGLGKLLYVYRAVGNDLRQEMKTRMIRCQKRVVGELSEGTATQSHVDLDATGQECSPDALMDEVVETKEFALAIEYSQRVCTEFVAQDGAVLARLQFKLLEFFPVKYADRAAAEAQGRPWGKVHEIVFPEIEGE
ncbi:MAG: hypothetical protein KUG77_18825 [Nannocystaceae bacterium]|nr:hypothetical protein [Nannocystaceae bacterium]